MAITDTSSDVRYRPKYIELGTDGDGADHVYRTDDETVHVIRDGEIVHVQALGQRSVDEWMAYVEAKRDWARRQYGVSLVDMLTAALEGGRE